MLFRVLSANSSTIILCPNTLAQTFSLALYGANGYNNGKSAITSVCALYSTKYSSSTSCITQAQMASHTMTEGLSSLFGNWFWITSGWEKYDPSSTWNDRWYGGIANSSGSSQTYFYGYDEYYTRTYNVCPTITLNSSVRFSRSGTNSDPYVLTLP